MAVRRFLPLLLLLLCAFKAPAAEPTLPQFVKCFEGKANCKPALTAYHSALWTIGWGSTKGVRQGHTASREQAEERLQRDLQLAYSCVDSVSVRLLEQERDAMASFVFNLGCPGFMRTRLPVLLVSDRAAVPAVMRRYVYSSGARLNGLVRRRSVEAVLFAEGYAAALEEYHLHWPRSWAF